ncbi:hypothetical protein OUZ56_030399 [Daphnia magna]|uniref:Uncharacterized protein n=1 Tax=Daphnia magna TaxID=35525 RepID=A0ABQ9ZR73_9CRUS|nr:hypothetical protein OUZ56_030399 [Daphnia magna]
MWERGKQKEMEALEGGERKRANQWARIFPLGCRPFHGDRVVLYSRTSPSHTVSLLAMNHVEVVISNYPTKESSHRRIQGHVLTVVNANYTKFILFSAYGYLVNNISGSGYVFKVDYGTPNFKIRKNHPLRTLPPGSKPVCCHEIPSLKYGV